MTQQWFAFTADNAQTAYGYGTADEAVQYAEALNHDRTADLYSPHPVPEDECRKMHLPDHRVPGLTWIRVAFSIRAMRTRYGIPNPE